MKGDGLCRKQFACQFFLLAFLTLLTLTGCTEKKPAPIPSADPYTFASPYLAYIGKTQQELLEKTGLSDENSELTITARLTSAEVEGIGYNIELYFLDSVPPAVVNTQDHRAWLKNTLLCGFSYRYTFDRAEFSDNIALIERIYDALNAEYGEPVERYKWGSWNSYAAAGETVSTYLAGETERDYGEFGEVWLVSDSLDFPRNEGCAAIDCLYVILSFKTLPGTKDAYVEIWYRGFDSATMDLISGKYSIDESEFSPDVGDPIDESGPFPDNYMASILVSHPTNNCSYQKYMIYFS